MRISDWSSDVCSSDLNDVEQQEFEQLVVGEARGSRREEAAAQPLTMAVVADRRCADRADRGAVEGQGLFLQGLFLQGRFLRSEERRVGKEWGRTCRFRWWPCN